MQFENQVQRIKEKIIAARNKDVKRTVFGAAAHHYELNAPIEAPQVSDFENQSGIRLPEAYREFLLQVGNGGAGPYYGIYPLGKSQYLGIRTEDLAQPCLLYPGMTEEHWEQMTDFHRAEEEPSDQEAYDRAYRRLFQGMIMLGTQGCTYHTMLITTGEHRGKVVYIDDDLQPPFFTYEAHFLDWYERWLDEVIGGYDIHWFGMSMGGDDLVLTEKFNSSTKTADKVKALSGMFKLPSVHEETIYFLAIQSSYENADIKRMALQLLTRHAYRLAVPFLKKAFESQQEEQIKMAAQYVYWYAKNHLNDWKQIALEAQPYAKEGETLRFMSYITAM